jgi:DNA-binding transcriptional LysR family regulator
VDLNNLAIFVAVVENGSLTKAAEKLRMPKSKVSRRLSQFEKDQAAPLLIRSTRKIQLTEVGKLLFERSQPLMQELIALEDAVSGHQLMPKGRLSINIPTDFFPNQFTNICAEFMEMNPQVTLNIDHFFGSFSRENNVEFGLSDISFALHHGQLPDSDLNAKQMMSLSQSLYGAPHKYPTNYLFSHDLSAQNCILAPTETVWFFQNLREHNAVSVTGRFHVPNQKMMIEACIAGLGIAKLTDADVESLVRKGTLIRLNTKTPVAAQTLTVLFRNKYLPLKARLFIDFFQSNIGRLSSRI